MAKANLVDDWNSTAAFDDLGGAYPTKPEEAADWGLFKATRSSIHHGLGYCSFHLYLVNNETGEEAELWFNNVTKGKNGLYAVKRGSGFARLYIDCFGKVNPKRFSKAHQLLKHFHKKVCLIECKTEYSERENGELYSKVVEYKSGNKLETNWKFSGNQQETFWKPQTHEPLVNTRAASQSQVIINNLIGNGAIEQYKAPTLTPLEDKALTSQSVKSAELESKYQLVNEMGGFDFIKMPNETTDQLYQRCIDATL